MASITGTNLDDVLWTTPLVDAVVAAAGNDFIVIAAAADHAIGETINGGPGYDRILFVSTTDSLQLRPGVTGIEEVWLSDAAGNTSATLDLSLTAAAASVALIGNAGANTLTGGAGSDTLVGNLGLDTIAGGAENDRVVMQVEDVNLDSIDAGLPTEGNTLALAGMAAGIVTIDLSVLAGADQLMIATLVDSIVQSDFSHVDALKLEGVDGVNVTLSTAANRILGSEQDDVFLVSASNQLTAADALHGAAGNDVLRFTATTFTTAATQTLTLPSQVSGLETVEITDPNLALNLNAATVSGQGLTLLGNDGANKLTGGAKNDTLVGNGGADTLAGGAGNDVFLFEEVEDVTGESISGGLGAADALRFSSTVAGALSYTGTISGLEIVEIRESDDTLGATALDLDFSAATIPGAASIPGIKFLGNDGANSITGTAKNDTIEGKDGTDIIDGGPGNDVVIMDVESPDQIDAGSASEGNTLKLVGSAAGEVAIDLSVGADANQLLTINAVDDGEVQSDFSHVDAADLSGAGIAVTASGAFNILTGTGQDDVFRFASPQAYRNGTVIDKVTGGSGTDVIRFTSTLAGGTLTLAETALGIEEVEISDPDGVTTETWQLNLNASAVKNALKITGNDGANKLTGTAFADTVAGGMGNDTIEGGKLGDTISGGAGNDTITDISGNDTYLVELGSDFTAGDKITDSAGIDTLKFTSTTADDTLELVGLHVAGISGVEVIHLQGEDSASTNGLNLEASAFNKSGIHYLGNDGDNQITTGNGKDKIEGGKGADTIVSGPGADTIMMNVDDGIFDDINAGVTAELNWLWLTGEKQGVFVSVDLSVTADQIDDPLTQTGFRHVDASRISFLDTVEGGVFVAGDGNANKLIGSSRGDVFVAGLGADTIEGGGGNDLFFVFSVAEYSQDTYSDNGGTRGDNLIFSPDPGASALQKTLVLKNNTTGIDVTVADSGSGNVEINASALKGPMGLRGNEGNNKLTATGFGESIFDSGGGADTMKGAGGHDDYVISSGSWVAGDRIEDSGSNELFFAGAAGEIFTFNTPDSVSDTDGVITGLCIDQFVVSSTALSEDIDDGPYIRSIFIFNNAGIDVSNYGKAVLLAGSYGDNALTGTKFADEIHGHLGQDTIVGGKGNDSIYMEVGDGDIDEINGYGDTIVATEKNFLYLTSKNSGDILSEPTGKIELDLGGPDQITGANGSPDDVLLQTGIWHLDASEMVATAEDTEDFGISVRVHPTRAQIIIGSPQNDVFMYASQAEFGVGAAAKDTIDGGGGNDEIRFIATTAGTFALTATMANFEILAIRESESMLGATDGLSISAAAAPGAMKLIGNDGANTITGSASDDTIVGNAGVDSLVGGLGSDQFLYEDPADADPNETINAGGGTADTLRLSTTMAGALAYSGTITGLELVEIVESDDTIGTTALDLDFSLAIIPGAASIPGINFRGNDGPNSIVGTSRNDTFDGLAGIDTIDGGGGADVINVVFEELDNVDGGGIADAGGNKLVVTGEDTSDPAKVWVWDLNDTMDQSVSLDGGSDSATFTDITHLDFSGMDGVRFEITGSAQANTLIGGELDDLFIVRQAADFATGEKIVGGDGNDILRFTPTIASGTALNLTPTAVSGIEVVEIVGGFGLNLNLAAQTGKMTIDGGAGQDTILAGKGADTVIYDVGTADKLDGGLVAEGNTLVLEGTAAGTVAVDLSKTANNADQMPGVAGIQSDFMHLDASTMAGAGVQVTGSAAANKIIGSAQADSISGGAGADTITMDVAAFDSLDGGAGAENDLLILTGAAGQAIDVDLSVAAGTDQVDGGGTDTSVQSDFQHLDASAMEDFAVNVVGSAAANRIIGTAAADSILGGAGADTIGMDVAAADTIDAGLGAESDLLILSGEAAGLVTIDLSVAPDADQVDVAGTQSDFQHVDLSALEDFGANVRGNALHNAITGTSEADTIIGGGGSDTINLGSVKNAEGVLVTDGEADIVVYESPADGWGSAGGAAAASRDTIKFFQSGMDKVQFTGSFTGGADDLDDIGDADDAFAFATNVKADFGATHEALLIDFATSKLTGAAPLYANSPTTGAFGSVLAKINKVGVTAAVGDDGLIVVQTSTSTGFYYYQETTGTAGVQATELTLLGVLDVQAAAGDFVLA